MKSALSKFKNNGFTLVEMLVVVGILGILSAAVIATLDPFSQFIKATDARRKSDLSQISKALEAYYADVGRYPLNNATAPYNIYDNRASQRKVIYWGQSWSPYMNILPVDPKSTYKYIYYTPDSGLTYYLYASLERGSKDPQVCSGNLCSGAGLSGMNVLCGGPCNYGIASPNTSP